MPQAGISEAREKPPGLDPKIAIRLDVKGKA
jgi:hypothetical protein